MAQFYTLEEAARVLGMSAEELKSKAQHREIRAFLDGGSWRFRVVDIDELARHRGLGSDAELRLSDLEVPAGDSENLEALDLSEFQLGAAKPDLANETLDISSFSTHAAKEHTTGKSSSDTGSDHDILFDDLSVPPNPVTGSSSVIIGMQTSGKVPSDSDVRLVPDNVKGASDSDVRLASPEPDLKAPSDSDVTLIKDDTADHNFLTPASAPVTRPYAARPWSARRPKFRRPSQTAISSSIRRAIWSTSFSPNRARISSSAPSTPAATNSSRPRYVPAIPT